MFLKPRIKPEGKAEPRAGKYFPTPGRAEPTAGKHPPTGGKGSPATGRPPPTAGKIPPALSLSKTQIGTSLGRGMWAARSLIALLSPGFGFHFSPLARFASLRSLFFWDRTEAHAKAEEVVPVIRPAPVAVRRPAALAAEAPTAAPQNAKRACRWTYRITC